jgi:integrase
MGVAAFTPHDLRRTVTTGLYEIDVDSYLIKRTLNHATSGVTDTHYNKHTFMRQRRAALEAWEVYLEQMLRGSQSPSRDNVVPFAKLGGR